MKTVLSIAYHYPPISSPGAERARAFQRYLPEHGFSPFVITTSTYGGEAATDVLRVGEPVGAFRSTFNPTAAETPLDVRSRLRTDAGTLTTIARAIRDRVMIPDAQIGWCLTGLLPALKVVRSFKPELVYTSSPPHSVHLLGWALKKLTGVSWVAEFRDLWTHDPLDAFLTRPGPRLSIERELERAVAIDADRLVGVTDAACAVLSSLAGDGKVRCVPNGFEPDETREHATPGTTDGALKLVHAGAFAESHPARSPETLVRAVAAADCAVSLQLVGPLTQTEIAVAERLGAGRVETIGLVPRPKALALESEADVLVLVDHERPVRATNIPSKCYEYLAMGKPILALTPDGATRDLLDRVGGGWCVGPERVDDVREAIERAAVERASGRLAEHAISPETLAGFSRAATAESMAAVFAEVC